MTNYHLDNYLEPVVDYEGVYCVSRSGNIYRVGKQTPLKQTIKSNGYHYVTLSKNNKRKKLYVHRIVAQAFIKNVDLDLEVNHIDGNKSNNTVGNLEWVTRLINVQHFFYKKYALISPNNLLVEFSGIREFARQNNLDNSSVAKVIKGKLNHTKGWRFGWCLS